MVRARDAQSATPIYEKKPHFHCPSHDSLAEIIAGAHHHP
jgi:hypothetical protein